MSRPQGTPSGTMSSDSLTEDKKFQITTGNEMDVSDKHRGDSVIESVKDWWQDVVDQVVRPRQKIKSPHDSPFLKYIDDYFRISTLKSSISTEIIGGITSFLATAYIMVVHPSIMSVAGFDPSAMFVVTAVVSGLASIVMGIIGGVPIIMAPGMGVNTFFVFEIIIGQNYTWQNALGITFIAGAIQFFIAAFGFRKQVIMAIPEYFRIGLGVGIAIFLALLGGQNMGLFTADPVTMITKGEITWRVGVGLLCLLLMAALRLRKWRSAYIVSIVFTSIVVVIIQAIINKDDLVNERWDDLSMSSLGGKLTFNFDGKAALIIPLFLVHHLFDAIATALVCLRQAYFTDTKIDFKGSDLEESLAQSSKVRSILLIDSVFVMISAIMGTTTTTPFIESATGISVGAKTGLSSVIAGLMFLLSTFIKPVIVYIAAEATGPALIITAMLLIPILRYLDFDRWEEVLPAMFTVLMIPFTFSISDGTAFGYAFLLCLVFAGKWRTITPMMWLLIFISLFQIIADIFITKV